jgi:hypothetical protein
MNINCTKQHIAEILVSVIALDRDSQEKTLLLLQTHTAYVLGSTVTGHGFDDDDNNNNNNVQVH